MEKTIGDLEVVIIECKLNQLRKMLLSRDGLLFTLSACTRGRGTVLSQNIVKLAMQGGTLVNAGRDQECLGWHQVFLDEKLVAMFTIKVRSALNFALKR